MKFEDLEVGDLFLYSWRKYKFVGRVMQRENFDDVYNMDGYAGRLSKDEFFGEQYTFITKIDCIPKAVKRHYPEYFI